MSEKVHAPRRTAEQWQDLVEQQIQSGLSGAAFCKSERLQYQSFMTWRKKLEASNEVNSPEPVFVELTSPELPNEQKQSQWFIELDLAPGVQLRIAR